MKEYSVRTTLLPAVIVALVAAQANAQIVSVSPDDMQGWVIVTNKGATAELVNHGPAVYEREKAFIAEDDTDLGKGAYDATIGLDSGATPPTAWLGLDTFDGRPLAGIALKRITSLEYYAYNVHIPTGTPNRKNWSSWKGWWTYPKQLIQLQLAARSPDGKQRKQFWFTPWQKFKVRGENCGRHCKKWLRYDAVNFNHPGPVVDRTNAMFVLDDGSGCVIYGFLYKDIKTTQNPARLGERWSVWGHMERIPFQPDDVPPLIWTSVNHMTKLSSAASE